jgi:hypothetical protein
MAVSQKPNPSPHKSVVFLLLTLHNLGQAYEVKFLLLIQDVIGIFVQQKNFGPLLNRQIIDNKFIQFGYDPANTLQ